MLVACDAGRLAAQPPRLLSLERQQPALGYSADCDNRFAAARIHSARVSGAAGGRWRRLGWRRWPARGEHAAGFVPGAVLGAQVPPPDSLVFKQLLLWLRQATLMPFEATLLQLTSLTLINWPSVALVLPPSMLDVDIHTPDVSPLDGEDDWPVQARRGWENVPSF